MTDTTTPQPANALPSPERARELLDYLAEVSNDPCAYDDEEIAAANDTAALLRDQIEMRALHDNAIECERMCPSPKTFEQAIQHAINKYSMENHSDTPDFLLAVYLDACLRAYGATVKARDQWYGFEPWKRSPPGEPPSPHGAEDDY